MTCAIIVKPAQVMDLSKIDESINKPMKWLLAGGELSYLRPKFRLILFGFPTAGINAVCVAARGEATWPPVP